MRQSLLPSRCFDLPHDSIRLRVRFDLSHVTLHQMKKSTTDQIVVITLIVTVLGVLAAWLVVPEFRKWTGLEKSSDTQGLRKANISGIVIEADSNRGVGQALIILAGPVEGGCSECPGFVFRSEGSGHRPNREEYQKSVQALPSTKSGQHRASGQRAKWVRT